jgi:hypothetical protein
MNISVSTMAQNTAPKNGEMTQQKATVTPVSSSRKTARCRAGVHETGGGADGAQRLAERRQGHCRRGAGHRRRARHNRCGNTNE